VLIALVISNLNDLKCFKLLKCSYKILGWNPSKTSLEELVKKMVDSNLDKVAIEKTIGKVKLNLAGYLEKSIII
jgi:hypothetical protein